MLVATRLLRPAADSLSDQVTFELLREWANLEQKHDIALPLRVAVGAVALTRPIRQRLSEMGGARREIATAALLFWPSSGELRQKSLVSYNPFRPDRAWIQHSCGVFCLMHGCRSLYSATWGGETTLWMPWARTVLYV